MINQFSTMIKFLDFILDDKRIAEDTVYVSKIRREFATLKDFLTRVEVGISPIQRIGALDTIIIEKGEYNTLMRATRLAAQVLEATKNYMTISEDK